MNNMPFFDLDPSKSYILHKQLQQETNKKNRELEVQFSFLLQ